MPTFTGCPGAEAVERVCMELVWSYINGGWAQVVFVAVRGPSVFSDIAIDYIIIRQQSCDYSPPRTSAPSTLTSRCSTDSDSPHPRIAAADRVSNWVSDTPGNPGNLLEIYKISWKSTWQCSSFLRLPADAFEAPRGPPS